MTGRSIPWFTGALAICGVMALLGAGPAAADNEYKGQTFSDAVSAIQQSGGTYKIGGKIGSFLPLPQCVVTGNRSANFLDSSGANPGGVVLLHLNCNYMFALPGVPGNSRGSTEGKAAYDQAVEEAEQRQQEAEAAQQAEAEQAAAEAAAQGG